MHGLINRSIQLFVQDTYGEETWWTIARAADIGPDGFEPMLAYDVSVTDRLLTEVSNILDKPPAMVLEDLGTYLVSHPNMRRVRRLLRFSGDTFTDFLHSLDDLPARCKLALPDLDLPDLELREELGGQIRVFVCSEHRGWGYVLMGLLRAMADDYGALILLDMAPGPSSIAVIEGQLLDTDYAEGRSFSLSAPDWAGAPGPSVDAGASALSQPGGAEG